MKKSFFFLLLILLYVLVACSNAAEETGTLEIRANGEDFVRNGFVSKDGWQIDFENVFVSLEDVTAYRTDPAFDAATGEMPDGDSLSIGSQTVDLAEGDASADPILLATLEDATVGQYNAVSWTMNGSAENGSVRLVGTAQKDGATVPFDMTIEQDFAYACGEYVGDGRKGFVNADGTGDVELTFHFDHVFGDADSPMDDSLNVGALGFQPLADAANGGELTATQSELEGMLSAEDYETLMDTLATLGHVGEGHCYEMEFGGFTAEK